MILLLFSLITANPVVTRIEIQGNQISHESIIRKELTFSPGDTLYPEIIDETIQAIKSSRAFSQVEIQVVDPEAPSSDVVVKVKEVRFPLPYPTLGIDGSTGFYLGAGVLYPNLLGRGVIIDLGGELGFRFSTPRHKLYSYLYKPMTYNRWHGEKLAYNYSLLWRKDSRIYHREHRITYRQDVRPWRPLTLSAEAGWISTYAYPDDPADPIPTYASDTVDRSWFVQPIVRLDFRDNDYDTRKGFFFEGKYCYNPGLTENFPTLQACSLSVAGYLPINDRNWLAANFYTYQQFDSIPTYRTIYVGRSRHVRGWSDTTQVGPCLSVLSLEYRNRFADMEFENLPLVGRLKIWWGANAFFDIGSAHEPGLPPLQLADLTGDRKDGLLPGVGIGLALGTGKLVGKLEVAWGVGSGLNGDKFAYSIPAYFGWRF